MTYSDDSCYQEINQNIGLYNDLKVRGRDFVPYYNIMVSPILKNSPLSLHHYLLSLPKQTRFNSTYAKPASPGPSNKTMMPQKKLKSTITLIATTCMIPSYAALPIFTSKIVSGDVRRRLIRPWVGVIIILKNSGVDLISFVYSSGALRPWHWYGLCSSNVG